MHLKNKILFLGPVPPPAGGVSIHLWRLKLLLDKDFNIDIVDEASTTKEYYNIRSYNPFIYIKKIVQSDLLYIQSGSSILRIVHLIIGKLFFKKILLTIHAYPWKKKKIGRWFESTIFNFAHKIIVVNSSILERLDLDVKKTIVQNAFIPPVMETEPSLPTHIDDWVTKANDRNELTVCANASRLDIYNNEDLYGLDLCIKAAKALKEKQQKINFIFIVSSISGCESIYEKQQQQIKTLQLDKNFLLLNEKISFVKLIEKCDVILRPTNTDGDALTIREGIFLGKQILASDVVERPAETLLFKNRDVQDMTAKLEHLLSLGKVQHLNQAKLQGNNEYHIFYTELIKKIINNKN